MRRLASLLVGVVASAPAAMAQELLSIEIDGPTSVVEQSATPYHCVAHLDTGSVDVTELADWSVEPAGVASIDAGIITVDDLVSDVQITISASYTLGETTKSASLEVSVIASRQLVELLAQDGEPGDAFGVSVALDDGVAIVGAWGDDDVAENVGAAYLFDLASREQIAKLLPADGATGDWFGLNVGIGGGLAIVGADGNAGNAGAAYVFDAATGGLVVKLVPDDLAAYDRFGNAVAIEDGLALVGSPLDDDNGESSGAAYLFDALTGEQIAKLLPEDGAEDARFGNAVALSGDRAIVGSSFADANGNRSGAAYLFDVTTGVQIAQLLPDDGEANERFGDDVAIDGDVALVGCVWDDDNGDYSGSAYLFDARTGQQIAKLLPEDGQPSDHAGTTVALVGDNAFVGAPYHDDLGSSTGAVYQFDVATGEQIAKILPHSDAAGGDFGIDIAAEEGSLLAGAISVGDGAGAAYLMVGEGLCGADANADGRLTIVDFVAFQLAWVAGAPGADCDANGVLDQLDFVCFQQLFVEGCD